MYVLGSLSFWGKSSPAQPLFLSEYIGYYGKYCLPAIFYISAAIKKEENIR